MKKEWVDSVANFLKLKPRDTRYDPPVADIEIRWKEYLSTKFVCHTCPTGALAPRTYVSRTTARDKDDAIEGGAYVVSLLGCEKTCPKFAAWRKEHPIT